MRHNLTTNPHFGLLNLTSFLSNASYNTLTTTQLARLHSLFHFYMDTTPISVIFQVTKTKDQAMARFSNVTFSTLRVDKSDQKKFSAWVTTEKVTPRQVLEEVLGQGFKVSLSWVFDQSSFCCSLVGTDNTKRHANMVMTTWSDDLEEVIMLAGYKHLVLCNGDEWPTATDEQRWG